MAQPPQQSTDWATVFAPTRWTDVVGNHAAVQAVRAWIRSKQSPQTPALQQQQQPLFCLISGPAGVGKTTVGRLCCSDAKTTVVVDLSSAPVRSATAVGKAVAPALLVNRRDTALVVVWLGDLDGWQPAAYEDRKRQQQQRPQRRDGGTQPRHEPPIPALHAALQRAAARSCGRRAPRVCVIATCDATTLAQDPDVRALARDAAVTRHVRLQRLFASALVAAAQRVLRLANVYLMEREIQQAARIAQGDARKTIMTLDVYCHTRQPRHGDAAQEGVRLHDFCVAGEGDQTHDLFRTTKRLLARKGLGPLLAWPDAVRTAETEEASLVVLMLHENAYMLQRSGFNGTSLTDALARRAEGLSDAARLLVTSPRTFADKSLSAHDHARLVALLVVRTHEGVLSPAHDGRVMFPTQQFATARAVRDTRAQKILGEDTCCAGEDETACADEDKRQKAYQRAIQRALNASFR